MNPVAFRGRRAVALLAALVPLDVGQDADTPSVNVEAVPRPLMGDYVRSGESVRLSP
jgi:hypothetical protein